MGETWRKRDRHDERIRRGGPGRGAYYGATHGKAVGGTVRQYDDSHLSRCEDGPDDCLSCARIAEDRAHEEKVRRAKVEAAWRRTAG